MADIAITPTTLTANVVSADILTTAEGGLNVVAGNTGVIAVAGNIARMIITLYAASAATVLIKAGDSPLAVRSGLGDVAAQSIPAGDTLLLCLEGGRFEQQDTTDADGEVRLTVATNTVVMGAFILPNTI